MPGHHFMLADLMGALRAVVVFPLFVLAPGYVAAWLLDLFEFRGRTPSFRLAFSAPLSISICPILTYLAGRFASMTAVWGFYSLTAIAFLVLLARERRSIAHLRSRSAVAFAGLLAVWLAVCLFSMIDLQIGERLYFSTGSIDHAVRTAFIHSISTTGIPPANPFFHAGHPAPLRYHYFFLLICSLADQVGGAWITARQALIGGTFWAGAGLIGLLAVYLRLFTPALTPLRRRLLTGLALLAITGLDIIPALFFLFLYARGLLPFVLPSIELWNEHVDWFLGTAIGTPHALCSLTACFVAFLLLWHAAGAWRYAVPAAIALASAAGASLYVAFVFAVFLVVWTTIALVRKWYRETAMLCIAGSAALVLIVPYLRDLVAANAAPGAAPGAGLAIVGSLFQFTVREFSLAALVRTGSLPLMWRRILVNGTLLPVNYFLEFGLFFLVARLKWLQHRASGKPAARHDLALAVMAAVSVLMCTFLRSSVIGNNDLGWRGLLIAQFALVLWAVDLFGERESLPWLTAAQKQVLVIFFAIGFAGTVTDLAMMRLYPVLADRGVVPPLDWMSPDRDFGRRTYAARSAYEWLQSITTPKANVQSNPNVVFQDNFGMIYSNRPMVAASADCLTAFGGDPAQCPAIVDRLQRMFPESNALNDRALQETCAVLPLDSVVVKDTDAVWRDRRSWVWKERPVYSNAYVRIYRCGRPTETARQY